MTRLRTTTIIACLLVLNVCAAQDADTNDAEVATALILSSDETESVTPVSDSLLLPAAPEARSEACTSEASIRRYKKQAIQKVSVSGGWLQSTGSNDVSTSHFDSAISIGIPLKNSDNLLIMTPLFRADWVDAASTIDIPNELFETGVSFFWSKPVNDRWSFTGIVSPTVRSDFTTSDNAIKIFGMGLLTWDYVPDKLSLSFGAVYLDRADLPVLPAAGLQWTPSADRKLDLKFPESRYSVRVRKDGAESETWNYVSGGLGGNSWAITRTSGQTDELSLRYWKLMAGIEHVVDGGGGWFAELGFAFGRQLEYESTETEVSLSDGVIFQAGWAY